MLYFLYMILILLSGSARSDSFNKGQVLEKGTRAPFAEVTLFILPEKIKLTTDAKGKWQSSLPDGRHTAIVNIPGYMRAVLEFVSPQISDIEVLVEKSAYNPYETTIQTKANTVQTSQKNISAAEASKIAGTGGDAIKAVQTLPGVARASAFLANVIIRGSGPNDTKYLIDGHEVPIIFHFGGASSVVNTDLLNEIIYLPGGFGSPYGRATGGLVGVTLRDPKSDRMHGYAFADVISAGMLIETPLGSAWSLGVTARRSYIGDVLKAVANNNPGFDFTVAPFYYDGLITATKKISETKKLRFSFVGSYDELSFLIKNPVEAEPGIRGPLNNITKFYRVIGSYTDKVTPDDTFRFSTAYGNDSVFVNLSDLYLNIDSQNLSVKTDWEHRQNLWNATRIGVDNQYLRGAVSFKLPQLNGNPISAATLFQGQSQPREAQTSVFAEHRLGLLRDPEIWTMTPGLRFERYKSTNEYLLSPRLATRYAVSDTFALRSSTGLYYQPPSPQYVDPVFGNAQIKSPLAIHYVLGFETEPHISWLNSFSLESDIYYKDLRNIIISDPILRFSNDGTGQAYGLEVSAKFIKNQWSGRLSYTLSQSTRTTPLQGHYPFEYDQTHNINLILGYLTTRQWEFGFRGRYVTGNPKTPITGARFDSDNDVYIADTGPLNSTRLPAFFEIDFRIDKHWVYPGWILNGYLDIQNLTNYQNVESISYSYNYAVKQYATGLPIIPNLGIKAEF